MSSVGKIASYYLRRYVDGSWGISGVAWYPGQSLLVELLSVIMPPVTCQNKQSA